MSNEETLDETLDRLIKKEFGDGFGNLVISVNNPAVNESTDNLGN